MDTLPVEMRNEIGKYLTSGDLKVMRLVDSRWNDLAKDSLHRRDPGPMTFTFDSVNRLSQFNDTFVNYEPMEELASAEFRFLLPLLASDEAFAHLDTFGQTFGQSVTNLSLRFQGDIRSVTHAKGENITEEGMEAYWFLSKEREAIDRNVTLLLAKVKGQLQTLELKDYFGLSPCVLGIDPFPALSTLKVYNIVDLLKPSVDREALGRVAAIKESCILELSRKVPAIQHFTFVPYQFGRSDDPSYLSTVLGNLVRANPEVRCRLSLRLPSIASRQSLKFAQKLTQVNTHIIELCLGVPAEGENREDFRLLMEYTRGQSSYLKKLILIDIGSILSPLELQLPQMPVLEELKLRNVSLTTDSLHFVNLPSLRRMSMDFSGNDLAVTFPSVMDLTLINEENGLKAETAGEDFRRFISKFPNLRSLNCTARLLALPAIFSQVNLTRLKIREDDYCNIMWKVLTEGSPKLTFAQIVALDVTTCAEGIYFKDLKNLRELVFTYAYAMDEKMEAILYISKIGRLKRLRKLVYEGKVWKTDDDDIEVTRECEYLRELRKYHDSVVVINQL